MIFVVTGAQEPFDRLVKTIDKWAGENNIQDVLAQTSHSKYIPQHIKWETFIEPKKFEGIFKSADLIIAHAGMGAILKSLENDKPLIVMPRLVKFKESRNDHQLYTAKSFDKLNYLHVVYNEDDLVKLLQNYKDIKSLKKISPFASQSLTETINNFFDS